MAASVAASVAAAGRRLRCAVLETLRLGVALSCGVDLESLLVVLPLNASPVVNGSGKGAAGLLPLPPADAAFFRSATWSRVHVVPVAGRIASLAAQSAHAEAMAAATAAATAAASAAAAAKGGSMTAGSGRSTATPSVGGGGPRVSGSDLADPLLAALFMALDAAGAAWVDLSEAAVAGAEKEAAGRRRGRHDRRRARRDRRRQQLRR